MDKPAIKSMTLQGLVVLLLGWVVTKFKLPLAPEGLNDLAGYVLDGLGALMVLIGRWRAGGLKGIIRAAAVLIAFGLLDVGPVMAEPTPANRQLLWEHVGGPDLAGFQLYWAPQAELAPRLYDNTRRVVIPNSLARSIVIIDAKPDATGGLCFRLTAQNLAGQESAFSDEVCGFFGFPAATGFRAD